MVNMAGVSPLNAKVKEEADTDLVFSYSDQIIVESGNLLMRLLSSYG